MFSTKGSFSIVRALGMHFYHTSPLVMLCFMLSVSSLSVLPLSSLTPPPLDMLGVSGLVRTYMRVHCCFSGAFDDNDVIHVEDDVNPVRDLEIISEELRKKVKMNTS